MKKGSFKPTEEEKLITEAILQAREIQEYIWADLSMSLKPFDKRVWVSIFKKRVDKIEGINPFNGNARVELRKRILQQGALSILALRLLDEQEEKEVINGREIKSIRTGSN